MGHRGRSRIGSPKAVGEIRDPVHGYIFITEVEKELLDTAVVQRLHFIKQLGGAAFAYPGAEHTRFGHSLGVMHLAGMYADHIANLGHLDEEGMQLLRIAGLLHDVGHGPFSHLFEELLIKHLGMSHEDVTSWLIRESEVKDVLNDYGFRPDNVADIAAGTSGSSCETFMKQVACGHVDADKLDYLVRDSHYTGVEYGLIDIYRPIYSSRVFGGQLVYEIPGALFALEAFLIARYEMFRAVYFHRTVRSAEIMLIKAMEASKDHVGMLEFSEPEDYLAWDDYYAWAKLRELASDDDVRARSPCIGFVEMLRRRRLLKCAYSIIAHEEDGLVSSLLSPVVRERMEEEIAHEANVSADYVLIDLPTAPPLPYSPYLRKHMEIPVVEKGSDEIREFSCFSNIAGALKGYSDLVRVYTMAEYVEGVRRGSERVFGWARPSLAGH